MEVGGKPRQTQRVANLSAGKPDLVVKRYVLGQDGQPEERGAWKSGALMGERHVDEDGKSVTVFTNLMGEKVLERQAISAGVFADTYYVYDDLGQLRFVLPPMCDLGAGKQQALEAYAYEYRYDGRSRVVYKRLPGCAPVRYWYDNRGRVVFTQDGELLKRGLCRFTFYDPHGRLAMQGTCTDTPHNVHSGVVTLSSVDGLFHSGYVGGVHLASPKVERINFYDDYNFLDGPSFKEYTNVNLMRKKNAQNATGHPTGSVTLTTGGERLYGVTYYTAKGLPCDTRQSSLGGKVLLSRTEYSFTDKPLRTVWEVRHDGRTDSVVYANSYSPVNDALAIQLVACNGGAPQFVSRLEYDDLGRLVRKTLPGNSGSVEYGHNVRGWLTTLSGPGYTETLSYDGLYNGNIASVSHSYQNGGVRDTFRYTFAYDNLNRMVSAGNDHYGESVDYDRNGNVVALHRYGKRNNGSYGLTDDLLLQYDGNQIRGITDRQGGLVYEGGFDFKPKTVDRHRPYEYNTVGALAHDPDRDVTVSYSVLGTPAMMAYGNGNTTEYIYDADGTKLKTTWKTRATNALYSMVAAEETGAEAKTVDGILSIQAGGAEACVENSREQVGPFIFTDGKLERALFDGGFCMLSGQHALYQYYVCDHLGSVRKVLSGNMVIQRNGYYAYGGPYGDWNTNADVQPLKFLGKEWDHQHGLDLYDFGARLYDPAVGRWTTMDPLCEKYYSVSPYAYCHNNPVNRIDPDGRDDYYSVGGQFLFRDSKKTDRIIIRDLVSYSTKQQGWEFGPNPDTPIEQTVLSAEAYSKIFTNILSEMKDVDIYLLHNQSVSVVVSPNDYDIESTFNDPYSAFSSEGVVNAATQHLNGVKKITACINYLGASDNRKLFATLSNVQNLLGVHEYIGHGVKGWSGSNHKLAYKNQFKHPSWKRTTGYFKRQELSNYQKVK